MWWLSPHWDIIEKKRLRVKEEIPLPHSFSLQIKRLYLPKALFDSFFFGHRLKPCGKEMGCFQGAFQTGTLGRSFKRGRLKTIGGKRKFQAGSLETTGEGFVSSMLLSLKELYARFKVWVVSGSSAWRWATAITGLKVELILRLKDFTDN